MAVTKTDVTSKNNLSGVSGATDAWLPIAGELYEAWCENRSATGHDAPTGPPTHPSFSGFVLEQTTNDGGSRSTHVYLGVCDQAPASAALTFDFGAETQSAIIIRVKSIAGHDPADPVRQSKVDSGNSTTVQPNVAFDVPALATGGISCGVGLANDSTTLAFDSPMVAAGNASSGNSAAVRFYNGFFAGQDDSPSGVLSTNQLWTMIAIEYNVAPSGGGAKGPVVNSGSVKRLVNGGVVS